MRMKIIRPAMQCLATTMFAVMAVLSCPPVASATTYVDSAHGNTAYGVDRSDTPDDELRYHTGSCAHCHDTFDPDICQNDVNGLMLFAPNNSTSQTENFCFECHKGVGTIQDPAFNNYNYTQKANVIEYG